MAERQSTHRQSLETTVIKAGTRNETLGLIAAAVLGITAIICGYLLVEHGKDAQGFSVILGTIGTLAGIFIWGRHRQEKERKEKGHIETGRPLVKSLTSYPPAFWFRKLRATRLPLRAETSVRIGHDVADYLVRVATLLLNPEGHKSISGFQASPFCYPACYPEGPTTGHSALLVGCKLL